MATMSNIEPYQPRSGLASRSVHRAVARVQGQGSVRLARLETEAELQAAKAHAVAYVGRVAMQDVALLSQVEQQLAQAVPHASGRLAAIADLTAVALSEVVGDTVHRIGRCR
jgi:hypothetical protein